LPDGLERAKAVLAEVLEPIRRIPRWLHGGVGYHRGPAWVNRLGYQVFRAAYKNVGWHLRSSEAPAHVRADVERLERDGCITIPDFLAPEAFARVRAEFDASRAELPYEAVVVEDNGVVEDQLTLARHPEAFPATLAEVVNSERLWAIVGAALRRPVLPPRASARSWRRLADAPKARGFGHVVGANYVHADMHFPTFKAWLYLCDIDEVNGAFRFALGSHKMTLARLRYEYDASIRVAANRHEGGSPDDPYALVRAPTERQQRQLKLNCTSIVGKKNTLVIANTQGFHQQGEFQLGTVREAIHVCFRPSEPT
jgi:hypothetical protein